MRVGSEITPTQSLRSPLRPTLTGEHDSRGESAGVVIEKARNGNRSRAAHRQAPSTIEADLLGKIIICCRQHTITDSMFRGQFAGNRKESAISLGSCSGCGCPTRANARTSRDGTPTANCRRQLRSDR